MKNAIIDYLAKNNYVGEYVAADGIIVLSFTGAPGVACLVEKMIERHFKVTSSGAFPGGAWFKIF
jgi:hypothetical protein